MVAVQLGGDGVIPSHAAGHLAYPADYAHEVHGHEICNQTIRAILANEFSQEAGVLPAGWAVGGPGVNGGIAGMVFQFGLAVRGEKDDPVASLHQLPGQGHEVKGNGVVFQGSPDKKAAGSHDAVEG